jgi:hypothetical protein
MAPRIFDPTLFKGQGALVTYGAMLAGHAAGSPELANVLADLKDRPLGVFLRWQVNPRIGMPAEPFRVWRRPALPLGEPAEIESEVIPLPPIGQVLSFSEPVVQFSGGVTAGPAPLRVVLLPVADGVGFENVLGVITFDLPPGGFRQVTFAASYITGVLMLGDALLTGVTALAVSAAEKIGGWELVETVGLPVDEGVWADLGPQTHGVKQGLTGAEVPAPDAAADRLKRGVNPWGWHPKFPDGDLAPKWEMPDAAQVIAAAQADLLPMLHDAMALPPFDQAGFTRDVAIPPPQSPAGQQMAGQDGKAVVAPLALLQMAVSSDPIQAVVLGFGTGYAYEDLPPVNFGAMGFFGDKDLSDWDYMVTGLWPEGSDGQGGQVEYAALIPRPARVLPAPPPADLALDFLGHRQPPVPDGPWSAAVRLSWERFVLDNLARVASFAVGRADLGAGGHAEALMERRPAGGGHLTIGDARSPKDPEPTRQGASDSGFPIPNDPGTVSARYGVATQNIFGIWSPWVTHPFQTTQPAPDLVQIVDADLRPEDPGLPATVCPAVLTLDIVVDWRVRRPASVTLGGRLFAAASRHQAPPGGVPAGVQKTLGGAALPVQVTFAGEVPAGVGCDVVCLNDQGSAVVAPGPAQGTSRRYRLTVQGFQIDFAATPHAGLALSARVTEAMAPFRAGAWSPTPKVAYASDPRARPAPPLPVVPLASLPDAAGCCHARIAWAPLPSAAGYVLYTSNEFALLDRLGVAHPAPGASLSQRLAALKAAFNANPDRTAFTRVNAAPLTVTSVDQTLPRGSQAIHVWGVLPLSAGGIEGPWPAGPAAADQLIVYAAPKVAEPAPPTIEVRRVAQGAGFAAEVRVGTRGAAGAHPRRIDLYRTRVADAAKAVDSMGLPVATLTGSGGGWTATPPSPGPGEWIEAVRGTDAPGGSWKHVWYRAVAWAGDLPEKGVRGGRSRPSPAVPVVVPPAGPPPLGPLSASWPGGALGDVQIDAASAVPVAPTPLGPHVLTAEVVEQGVADPLLRLSLPLHQIAAAPPGAGASGLWRPADGAYRMFLRRADTAHALSVTLRLTDPIGRSSERTLRVDAGPILPPPAISPITSFTIAGRGKVFTFTVENTQDLAIAGVPWRLRLTLVRAPAAPGPGPFPLPLPQPLPGRGGRFTPLPGPVGGLTPTRPGGQFVETGGALVYDTAVADIPAVAPDAAFAVTRQRIGGSLTITLFARERLRSIEARVTAPDGAEAVRRARG